MLGPTRRRPWLGLRVHAQPALRGRTRIRGSSATAALVDRLVSSTWRTRIGYAYVMNHFDPTKPTPTPKRSQSNEIYRVLGVKTSWRRLDERGRPPVRRRLSPAATRITAAGRVTPPQVAAPPDVSPPPESRIPWTARRCRMVRQLRAENRHRRGPAVRCRRIGIRARSARPRLRSLASRPRSARLAMSTWPSGFGTPWSPGTAGLMSTRATRSMAAAVSAVTTTRVMSAGAAGPTGIARPAWAGGATRAAGARNRQVRRGLPGNPVRPVHRRAAVAARWSARWWCSRVASNCCGRRSSPN